MNRVELANKTSAETKVYSFDFADYLAEGETIDSAEVTLEVYSGEDSDPAAMLNGAAAIDGSSVLQSLQLGTEGVLYEATCEAETSEGQTLTLSGYLAVVPGVV